MRFFILILSILLSLTAAGWVLSSAPGSAACRSAYDAAGLAAIEEHRKGISMSPALIALNKACH
jgi:hypothetical protein